MTNIEHYYSGQLHSRISYHLRRKIEVLDDMKLQVNKQCRCEVDIRKFSSQRTVTDYLQIVMGACS